MSIFYHLPEWVCFIATIFTLQLSHEAWFRIGTRRRLRPGENPETAAGAVSGITIGFLAFMLAFTFNAVIQGRSLH
jgi:hypothetical protein